jgi:hypothetical protein
MADPLRQRGRQFEAVEVAVVQADGPGQAELLASAPGSAGCTACADTT